MAGREDDLVHGRLGTALRGGDGAGKWLVYLSSTGVYEENGGAWVREEGQVQDGLRVRYEESWRNLRAEMAGEGGGKGVFRLGRAYGPVRNAMTTLENRQGRGPNLRLQQLDKVCNRVHVEDVARVTACNLQNGQWSDLAGEAATVTMQR